MTTALRNRWWTCASILVIPFFIAAQGGKEGAPPVPSLAEPGISADGSTIAFVNGGDIWEVSAAGGDARLLVSHPATESRPMYSPDGARLAFTSTRTGNGDIYALTLATGELARLTFDDANELVNGWSPDGKWIYFSSSSHDLSSMNDVFRVDASGGTPMPVAADRYATEYFGAPAPSGDAVAITARGFAGLQWWRKGHSHLDESEIWIVRPGAQPKYEQVTAGGAKDEWPMWSADARALYYMSDRNGTQNIWAQALGTSQARPLTTFTSGRVLWPTISRDGRRVAFERDLSIWTLDTATGDSRAVPIALRGTPAGAAVEHRAFSDHLQELALSPDGRKVAFTVHGEVFSASAKDGGDAIRLTTTTAEEAELAWAPDSRRLVYMSDRDGTNHLYLYDFATGEERQLTNGPGRDDMARFSPDGKWIAFERNSRELRIIDPNTRDDRLVASGMFDVPPFFQQQDFAWSPDSRFIAYLSTGARSFSNVFIAPIQATASTKDRAGRQVSFLANTFAGSIAWSPDGTYLMYGTGQRTEPGQIVRIDLIPRTPKFQEDQFRDLFKTETPKSPSEPAKPGAPEAPTVAAEESKASQRKPVDIVYDDIRRRASILPVGVDVDDASISPDGKWLLLTASAAGQQNLYVYSLDELSKEPPVARQLTSTPGAKSCARFTPDSKELMYLDRGRVFNVSLEKREPKPVAVNAELDVDFSREKLEAFHQAWSYLRDQFFDEKMNGVDWNAVRETYAPHIAAARTSDEMRRVISLMLGELNASHMGISPPAPAAPSTTGRLAADFDPVEYEAGGRLRLTHIVPLGPAALGGLKVGEYLLEVDHQPIQAHVNLDALLEHKIGRRVELSVAASPGAAVRVVAVKPIDQTTEKGVRYREWVEGRRDYVARASGGRLGYVHMYDMSAGSLSQLYIDLDAQNQSREGVVIDVHNNNGGFVNVYAIDVLARRGYFNMLRRGFESVSSRTLLGQRALERPTILVTNQHSLSDAEDFTEGYRTLKLGKVVGERTAGWIIYTGSVPLVDGSSLRMPGVKIYASDGSPMEMHPRPVDLEVKRAMGESYTGKDTQLDAAVAELLKQIGAPAKTTM
jgi:Tol biopolymer transport system component/C-terminal processing protease CtpA/Prc